MSVGSRIFTALLGLALIWFFWPFGGSEENVTAVTPPPTAKTAAPLAAPPPPRPATADPAPKSAAHEPVLLAREKADAARHEALTTEVVPKPQLKPKLYYRVVVRDGATLESGDIVIALKGIKAREADATCKDAKGRAWRCGARARAALTRLIRGRAVSCKVPEGSKQKTLTADCSVGGTELSIWMVAQGWAEPTAPKDAKLAEAETAARKNKAGLWR